MVLRIHHISVVSCSALLMTLYVLQGYVVFLHSSPTNRIVSPLMTALVSDLGVPLEGIGQPTGIRCGAPSRVRDRDKRN